MFMVFNATFNTISAISWRSVLFVEETEYLEKNTDLAQVTQLYIMVVVSYDLITSLRSEVCAHKTGLSSATVYWNAGTKSRIK